MSVAASSLTLSKRNSPVGAPSPVGVVQGQNHLSRAAVAVEISEESQKFAQSI
jgi:hypothetical protein